VWPAVLGCIFHAPFWAVSALVWVVNTVGVCHRLVVKCTTRLATFAAGLVHIGHSHVCAKPGKARF
jgi:hypothetical protein